MSDNKENHNMPDFPDDVLMRFADGELDAATAERLEAAMESDEALVARVELFMETRLRAKQALEPLLNEPVPAELAAAVETMIAKSRAARQESPPAATSSRQRWVAANDWRPLAAAAAIAAVAGGLAGYWAQPAHRTGGISIAAIGDPALAGALVTVQSGSEATLPDGRFKAIATFRDASQALCREFEWDAGNTATVSVACLDGGIWTVRFAVSSVANDQGYAPATSVEALDAYLAMIGATAPLDAEEEANALKARE